MGETRIHRVKRCCSRAFDGMAVRLFLYGVVGDCTRVVVEVFVRMFVEDERI